MNDKVNDTLQWLRDAEQKFRELAYGDAASPRPKIGLAFGWRLRAWHRAHWSSPCVSRRGHPH
jgi:hypothetical protein